MRIPEDWMPTRVLGFLAKCCHSATRKKRKKRKKGEFPISLPTLTLT
jgi:hypothetical protein